MCVHHVLAWCLRGVRRERLDPTELELWVFVSPVWMLRIDSGSSERAASASNC